jgi:murein DD-endopeptidase MepM/ murein hydrolase activator NlpD
MSTRGGVGRAVRRRLLRGVVIAVLAVVLIAVVASTWRARPLLRYREEATDVVVPVMGVAPSALTSSWGAPRSGGRRHEGIDIFAARGTPVVAATRGEVVRIGQNRLGGNVVWVAGAGARLYYYAHLSRFRTGLSVGEAVEPGTVLGYVGTSGNAAGTPPHLHFGMYPLSHGLRAVDPHPFLVERGRRLAPPAPARASRR